MSLQGTLKTLGITEVLEFLAARNATGQLDVTTEMGTAAYLFSDGDIAQSEYSFIRERGTDAAEATYYVVTEVDGTFFFDEDEEPLETSNCEEVSSVLGRTADIAEKWLDVEESIPTPNHLLIRNDELDGSVTIQPEWWKALEVISSGKTSLQVAELLNMGVLEASLLLLAMTNAGLLNVKQIDPLEIDTALSDTAEASDTEVSAALSEPTAQIVDAPALEVEPLEMDVPAAPEILAPDPVAVEPVAAPPVVAEQAVQPAPVVEVEHVAPPAQAFADVAPPAEPVVVPEPASIISSFEPAHQQPAVDPVEAPMQMQEIIEPVAEAPVVAPIEAAPTPVVDDNDGWASNHSPSYDAPVAEMPAAPIMPEQVLAPMPEATPPVHSGAEMFESNPVVPQVPEAPIVPAPEEPAPIDHNAQNTAMAGEVLSDLATLSDQLGDSPAGESNWQLDGTFVAEEAPTVAEADTDPFGDLGELLSDTDEEDRGSVLKFLRRD